MQPLLSYQRSSVTTQYCYYIVVILVQNGHSPQRKEDMDSTFSGDNTTDSGHGSNDGESEAPKSPSHVTQPPSIPHNGKLAPLTSFHRKTGVYEKCTVHVILLECSPSFWVNLCPENVNCSSNGWVVIMFGCIIPRSNQLFTKIY